MGEDLQRLQRLKEVGYELCHQSPEAPQSDLVLLRRASGQLKLKCIQKHSSEEKDKCAKCAFMIFLHLFAAWSLIRLFASLSFLPVDLFAHLPLHKKGFH